MTMVARLARPRAAPSLPVMLGVVAVVVGGLTALAVITETRPSTAPAQPSVAAERAAVEAYADAIAPAAEDAGRAIILGIRPDMADFTAGRISVEVWQTDMDARARQFERAREAFAAASAPAIVGDAPEWFDRAFTTYLEAVSILRSAGDVEGDEREALIDRGADVGERGDQLFNRGAARVQEARRALGLGADPRFPDKEFS